MQNKGIPVGAALEVKGLFVGYGTAEPVLTNFSLQMAQGEVLAVLGASGCGKTTLIQALAGGLAPRTGSIRLWNKGAWEPLSPRKHNVGLVPQKNGLLPWKTLEQNCLLPMKLRGQADSPQKRELRQAVFAALGLKELLARYPHQVSGGQAQRAAVARAFVMQPQLLLLDEPFSALDAIAREEAAELFLQVWQQTKPATVLVTHSIAEALYLGTHVGVMAQTGGVLQAPVPNPYFAKVQPQDAGYWALSQALREQIRQKGGEPPCTTGI